MTSRKRSSAASVADAARIVAEAAQLIAEAERDRAVSALKRLLTVVDRKSYMTPDQQGAIWEAAAVVAESEGR